MRTLVVSDLHLGARTQVDLLRAAEPRARLMAALADIDRLVLLGDIIELRHGPVREIFGAAEPFFSDLREALPSRAEVVLLAGNHDHELVAPWLARRAFDSRPAPSLGLENQVEPEAAEPLARLVRWLEPHRVRVAYPGVWLRPDVYATHGHYLDRHVTVPSFERVAVGVTSRVARTGPGRRETPDRYEAALAPIYALIHAMAQGAPPQQGAGPHTASSRIWKALAGGSRRPAMRRRALRAGFGLMIAGLNRAGVGPLRANVSPPELRRAGLRAMGEAATAMGIEADHVIFGHTHRAGPWPKDDAGEWATPGRAQLMNTGSWVYERHFLTSTPEESPYWPGVGVVVDDEGPPQLRRFLCGLGHAEVWPGGLR
ncbi:MAG: metallophosphoesterase [Solirubrobacteraceae bacterium]